MRAYHFLVTVTVAWSCGFYSIGLGQEGALPVTTDLHAHGLNEQQLDSLADIMQQLLTSRPSLGVRFLSCMGRGRFSRGIWVCRY